MNWREKQLRFSIRKLKVAVASTVVGISVFGVATPAVQANQIVPAQQAAAVNYRYVLESELTDAEKNLIQTQLPSHQVGDYSTYYMVYRPISSKATASLPSTGMEDEQLIAGLGLGLLIIGVSLVAGKKRRVISSIFFLTAAGAVSVSALGGGSLSVYDHRHQLAVGASLPETAITIANHEFVGYILEKAALPAAKPADGLEEPAQPTEETKPEEPTQPVEPTEPGQPTAPGQPVEPTQPLQPTNPAQPELTTELQEIDFATEIIDDPNLALGQEVVAQEGRKGQKRLTFDGDQLVSEEVLEQPVNRVILRGTKSVAVAEETRLEALPFTTEYQDDPTLAQGQEQLVREGQDGLRQDRYVNGQVVASEVLREPVNRLVKRGTKVDQPAPVESTVYENVAFETIVEPDPSLPLGQEVVVQEGQTGRKESKYLDGQLVSSVILDAPVAQIIRRGTKVEGQEPVETVTYDEVAFESIVEEDPSLPVGEEVLVQAGQVGRKENKFLDGQLVSSQVVQEPVNQIIRKGTRVIEGTVEVSREVELPFDTKVVADDSQYTDYQVTTPGQNGKAIVIDTYRTVNGVQVGLPISSRQETIDAPVDQVLTVGTKPIVDQTTVETLIEVQPDLETKYDDSQYADYNMTTPGQAGQIKRTETYVTVKGEKTGLPLDSKDEVISPATPTVVTIGTKPLEGTVDLSRLVELAFGTDTVTDDNQYEDFTETIPGTPGQQEIIETFKTLKGEKIGEPIATAEGAVTAPVNAKIVTGTKPIVGSVEETREEEIAFTTETQYDDTKYTDYISETPGQLGAKILTEAFQTIKGEKVGQPTIKEERVTKEPVNHVIIIGTKPIEDTVLETRTEAYTVEPETRYAEEEYEDYSVEIEGTPGTKEISERFQTIKGEKVGLPSLVGETILVPATPKVFLIGSKAIEGQVTETRKEVIEPETVIVYDDTKYEDYREEIAGTPGEKEVTETFRTLKGDKTEIILESSEKVLAEPIAKQIILGRMALAGVESTERIMEVAYVTRLVEDPDQYFGYRKEEGGQPGTTKVYETYQTIKGVRTGEPTLDREEVLTAPVDLVVTIGVKPIVATDDDKQVIALPFNTTTVKDETKYTDYREVTTTGQDGQLERVTTYRTVRGQRVGEPISVVDKTLNEPVGEVITIGTKEIEGEVTLPPRTEERDFAVEEIKDPDRYTDYYHEEGGVKGEVQITETFKTIKGQIEGNPIKSEERVITDPVKKVITVGTKPLNGQTQVVREEAIPFDTEVKYDNDQYEDYAVETGGTPGKAEITETYNTFKGEAIGQPTASERVVKEEPVNNIRTVGTKPINWTETVVDKVALPFDTIEETDADQYEDYEVVRVEGVDGEKTITTVYKTVKGVRQPDPTVTEETTKPVVNKVIVKGIKPIYGEKPVTRTEPVDFTTREVKDPDQYTDYRKEEGGVAGVKTITEVFKTEKGELTTELLRSSEAVTTDPIEKVITVGTKPIYGEKPVISTEPIPVTEEIQLDPNKLASSSDEVLREGTEGIRTITKTYKTEKGVIVGDPIAESSTITTPMETRLIKRGTKVLEAEKQEPKAVVQTVAMTAEPIAEQSIQPGLENVRSYTWKENAKPSTTESSDSVSGTVIVTYNDGSTDEVPVTIIVRSEADKQAPAAKEPKQVVGLNSNPSAEASIDTTGLTNVRSYDWLGSAPTTTASNPDATGKVRVTYTDGSYDDVPVSIIVQSEADKQAPAAKADQQVLGLNQVPVPATSIATDGLTNVASYTWVGEAPSTAASNANVPATVRVTYTDGSYDDVLVSIKVVSEADKQAPTAKADQQVLGLNQVPVPAASIATDSLTNVASYTWLGEAPSTVASNANVPATVRVTYTDGSYDDVPVSIKVVSEADKQNPTAKAEKQVVGLNSTPSAEASIETSGLTNVDTYTWLGSAPATTASNPNATGTVRVTYTDGSYDDVPVSIIVQSEADKQNPTAKAEKQVVGLNVTPDPEASINTTGLERVRSYTWKPGATPVTTASNPAATGTVLVTYEDGSVDEVAVDVIVQSEADKQNPTAKAEKQVVGLNVTPDPEASINTTGLERVRSYTWKPGATPVTTASNPAATGTVLVTYEDGSVDEVAVDVIVQSEADKQNPTAKEPKQVVGLNSTPSAEASIDIAGLTNVRSYDWFGSAPTTTASNPNATGTVRVTYTDGSYDDVSVSITVQSEADKQNPTAKSDKQVVGLNSTPSAEASIDTAGLTNVRSYDWVGSAPTTTASNPNATGTVRVTYTDGSYDDVPVSITVQSEADKQNPTAKVEKQVVGLNVTPDPEASINTTGLERVRSYTWKSDATLVTTASNPAATGTVLVTYEDGSVDEVAVDVVVQSDADRQTPKPVVQKVNLKDTPNPEKSIEAGLPTGTSYAWKDGVAPVTTASTMASGQGVAGTVIVTYPDGSKDEVQVTVQVESDADRGNPTPATVKQSVKVDQQPVAADSINKDGLAKAVTYEWKTAPDTSTAATDLDAIVVVTYEDGSKDEVPVKIEVLPNKTKPTLVLEKLTELDDDKKINLNYELTDPTNAKTSIKYEIYNGTEKVKEGTVDSNNPFDVDGLDWHIPYTLKTTMTYDLGQGPVVETLEDVPFELEYKKLEIKDVDSLSLYKLENGEFVKQAILSGEVADTKDYFVRITSDRFRDMLLPVRSIQAEGAVYRVTTDIQELVEDKDASANSDYQDQFSFLVKKAPTDPKIFTTFRSLVEAMRLNPTGEFIIGAELNADDMTVGANELAYVTTDFRGSLTGLSEGQQNAITNLKIPLFNKLIGGRVSNLDLKNVAINTTRSNVGTVANEATGSSRLTDVSVQGSLTASHNIGGLVFNNVETVLDNTSFTGRLTATSTATSGDAFNGGLVGVMTRGTIQNSYVNADITVTANSSGTRTGGIIGFNNNGFAGASFTGQNVQNVYTEGSLTNKGTAGQTGGIIGSNDHTHYPGRLKNVVNKMTVTNGNPVYGTTTIRANSISDAYTTTGTAQQYTSALTSEDATNRQNAMGITTSLNDSIQPDFEIVRSTDYTTLLNASADRETAYANVEKLMPFYNKELVVKYGNLVDSVSKLYTTKLLSVTPMKDNAIVSDVNSVKTGLNKLMLHYADNTIGYLDVTYTGDFKNTAVSEYDIVGTKLIYTPEQFLSSYDALIAEVLPTLKAVEYKSSTTATVLQAYTAEELEAGIVKKMNTAYPRTADFALTTKALKIQGLRQLAGMTAAAAEAQLATWEQEFKTEHTTDPALISTQMDKLYLEPTFDKVKENLESLLKQVLSTDKSVNTTGGIVDTYLADYIKDNKEKLLMGLAYMTRWYNIDFKNTNIKDLATFHQDFFGQKQVNTLEWLVELGSSYERLAIAKNLETYKQSLAANTGKANLTDYLTANRTLFTDYADDNTWFKETTTAYVYEGVSKHVPQSTYDTRVYSMLNTDRERNGILPLLTAREGIYIMTNMGGISYGMFDRYYSGRGQYNDATPPVGLSLEEQKAYIRQMVDRAGKRQVDHFDAWYRLAPADVRDKIMRAMPMPTWDGYNVNGVYLPKEGAGANDAILDFFGPVGTRSTVTQRGMGAYANGTSIYFVIDRLLDSYGSSVYTHEAVHNNDGAVYLGGFGRRPGAHPEYWTLGLLQSSSYPAQSATFLTLNLMFDYEAHKDSATRYTNLNPERFQNSADLKTYMHGVFDVLYTLDYAEATIAANLSTASKRNLYGVMAQNMSGAHATSVIRTMSESEAAALTDWEKFIDGNIVGRRENDLKTYGGADYNHSYMFTPTYAALANNTGSPGILMFKRMAFELMADKGYEDGFIPYTSGKLKTAADDVVTDEEVLRAVYGTTYNTWADFKKAMFQERIAKRDNLSAITITYLGRQEQISSYADIERLMTEAMTYDSTRPANVKVTAANSRVHALKAAIYNAYLRQTDDFRTSIYN